jgi:chemotaxis protein MotB
MSYYQRRHRPRSKRTEIAHGDDWLMTYADMITLLLCFFMIFMSMSVPKKIPGADLQLEPTTNPRPDDRLEGNLPFHGLPVALGKTEIEPEEIAVDKSQLTQSLPEADKPKAPPAKLEQKGDRLTSLEMNSATSFDVGSATLNEGGKSILQDVTATLKSDQYKDYIVTVEGHTDDSPISTPQFPSNWELSTARAAAVVHFFLDQGIAPQKLRAAGYADAFPKAPNRDFAGNPLPENQAANRRVVIKLEKIEKAQ